jgi:hypothetical protein
MKTRTRAEPVPNGPETGLLAPKQEAAAVALAAGATLGEAAKKSGAGVTTIKTWTATVPAFGRRVAELRCEMTSRALGRMTDNLASAADTLGFLARKGKSEQVRLGAARAVIELGVKLRETVELETRISALEAGRTQVKR